MAVPLCLVFLLSGFAALVFEALWFRLAGLALGNSVWASSTVLAGFMAGLALGNGLAAAHGRRARSPLALYAILELLVAVTGVALVLGLPRLAPLLAQALAGLVGSPGSLNLARAVIAFGLMVVPTTAMGATLPLLARSLGEVDSDFGRVLGRLYGWNTLGGMAGALVGEAWAIERFGLAGTALCAGALNLAAALGALALARRRRLQSPRPPEGVPGPRPRYGRPARLLLAATLLSGGGLLALEVVWFRFLQLFLFATSLSFAVMLSVVLLGIGLGGLLASLWLARRPADLVALPSLALVCGASVVATYAGFEPGFRGAVDWPGELAPTLALSLRLMLAPSLLSGTLFTFTGRALRAHLREDAEAAGALTLANTTGAMLGAWFGGFVLLPTLGIERSLMGLALLYAGIAGCLAAAQADRLRPSFLRLGPAVLAFVACALVVPSGLMDARFLRTSLERFLVDGSTIVAFREGLTETISYLRLDWGRRPLFYKLVTNGHSMSSSTFYGRRYMSLYVQWALALRPNARKALLISYGLGTTAQALAAWQGFEAIDVVDTSADVLQMSGVAFPPPESSPLRDARVRTHVEDGRFFLLTTSERFDLITSEPPPPRGAGVVNLYSREYFRLLHDRLRPGGIVTYWLPVNQLSIAAAKAITRAFCLAFTDCSLWNAAGHDWMLAGSRGFAGAVAERDFLRPWQAPQTGAGLREAGIEVPEQLGALFLADSSQLEDWTRGVSPVEDDHPRRVSDRSVLADRQAFRAFAEDGGPRRRFESSLRVRALWPPALRERSLPYFRFQEIFDRDYFGTAPEQRLADLAATLTESSLRVLPLLLLDSEPRIQRIARAARSGGAKDPGLSYHLGAGALAAREYREAAGHFAEAEGGRQGDARVYQALALTLAGDLEDAARALEAAKASRLPDWARAALPWLEARLRASGASAPSR